MRTRANVNLDDDAYNAAVSFAAAKGLALGAAISELIRRAEQVPETPISASTKLARDEHGFLVVKGPDPVCYGLLAHGRKLVFCAMRLLQAGSVWGKHRECLTI